MKTHFYLERNLMGGEVNLHLRFAYPNGSFAVAQPGTLWSIKPDELGTISEEDRAKLLPVISFRDTDAPQALQSLMDELWREGYRPTDVGTAGHLSATQKHLDDMRSIVSKQMGVNLK